MRDFLSGPAVLGDSVSPENYDSGSGRLYLSMVAVKHWRLDTSNLNEISEDYYQEHASKGVLAGDVLMARSGEGTIGKVGYALSDTGGICADFMIRMRPKSDIIRPAFLYYSLVSNYYQRLIYGEKKGLGNNTNIFPNQIHEFPIIDVCIADQDTIIRDLNAIVAKFDADILKARRLRNEIEFHLVKAMSA